MTISRRPRSATKTTTCRSSLPLRAVLTVLAPAAWLATPLAAQQPPAAPPGEEAVHVVRPGDTLWDLAGFYLGDPFLWPEIFRLNTAVVRDPALIYPRERLRIPRLAATAADAVAENAPEADAAPAETTAATGSAASAPMAAAQAATPAPAVLPGDFYAAGLLVSPGELRPVGRLEALRTPDAVPSRSGRQLHLHERALLRLETGASVQPGERVHLVRVLRRVKPRGELVIPSGVATVERVESGVATVAIERVFAPVQLGDRALPLPPFEPPSAEAAQPADGPAARVVAFQLDQPIPAVEDIVFLDVGRRAGVREGDEFEVSAPAAAEGASSPRVARLRVVRVTETAAAARVVELKQPALRVGLPARRVLRMP